MDSRMMFDSDCQVTHGRYSGRHRKPIPNVRGVLPFRRSDQGLAAARPAQDDGEDDAAGELEQRDERDDPDAA